MIPPYIEERSFPSHLADDVRTVVVLLARNGPHAARSTFPVRVGGEALDIPWRVYYPSADARAAIALGGNAGLIAACLGTRHHDGYLRQLCVGKLLHIPEPWVVPYVIELLGEYVIEISNGIAQALQGKPIDAVMDFARDNRPHVQQRLQRAISYWNAYYRYAFPTWQEFPACAALSMLLEQSAVAAVRGQPRAASLD